VRDGLAGLAVDDEHWRDLVAKEDAWDASKAVACRMPGFLRRAVPFAEIALVAGDAVLVSLERLPAERLKARRDDLQEILKHVVALLCVRLDAVQWVDDAQAALEPLRLGRCGAEVLFLAAKVEAVHDVSEIVVMLALQVGNEIVDVHRVRLEGASRREVEVADDLVYSNFAGNVAALGCLLPQLLREAFLHALFDGVGVDKGPSSSDI